MDAQRLSYRRSSSVGSNLLLLLLLVLSACNTRSEESATPTPAVGIQLGPQPCPNAVKDPAYWDTIIGTRGGDKVERVVCGNLIGNTSLQALATVRAPGRERFLDVYVYNSITSTSPERLFRLQGLRMGDAKLSKYNTILTAQVDEGSSINKGQPPEKQTQDLFREFKGSDGTGTFVQIAFPGMFPDLTRFQAEADQDKVKQGQDSWKLDPAQTAYRLATTLLAWKAENATATLLNGGGTDDLNAVVVVKATFNGMSTVPMTVFLSRLEGNNQGGIWEVTATRGDRIAITSPQAGAQLTSPVTVTGYGPVFEGEVGPVYVMAHLYNKSDFSIARAQQSDYPVIASFSSEVNYNFSFRGGSQEGIVVLQNNSPIGLGSASVMVKVLLSA